MNRPACEVFDPVVAAAVIVSIERCLARAGAFVPRPSSYDLEALGAFWQRASAAFDGCLGLEVAEELPVGSLGLVSYGVLSAPTVGEGLHLLRRDYLARVVPGLVLELTPYGATHIDVCMHGDDALIPFAPLEEMALAILARHLAVLPVEPVTIRAVGLRRPAPACEDAWVRTFGVRPRFHQPRSWLRLPAAALDLALRSASPELQSLLGESARPSRSSTAEAVRAHLLKSLRRPPSPRSVARALGLSARTLQRRLAARGTTFRRVLTALRIDVARTMLRNGEASVAEIADAVGFERVSSLSRSFAACTGEPPLAYRKRVRAAVRGGLPAG